MEQDCLEAVMTLFPWNSRTIRFEVVKVGIKMGVKKEKEGIEWKRKEEKRLRSSFFFSEYFPHGCPRGAYLI